MDPTEIKELKGFFINGINDLLQRVIDTDQLTDLYPLIRKVERQCDAFRGGLVTVVRNARDNGTRHGPRSEIRIPLQGRGTNPRPASSRKTKC